MLQDSAEYNLIGEEAFLMKRRAMWSEESQEEVNYKTGNRSQDFKATRVVPLRIV